jgi:outer membrane lipoprotein-sorting protein
MRSLWLLLLSASTIVSAQEIHIPEALSGKFSQTREIKQAAITLRSEGSFCINKGKGIKWKTEKPFNSMVTLSPGTDPVGGEAAKQVAAIMQGLLVQDYAVLSKYFDVTRNKKKNGFEVRLKTMDETVARIFSEIVITGEKYIKTVVLSNRQGDKTTIRFTDIRESNCDFSDDGQ